MRFADFFGEEKSFPLDRTDLKTVARWCYDWCANEREKLSKSEKYRSEMKAKFYNSFLPHIL